MVEDLNRAYAHLATSKFSKAAQELTDKLIAMGFEEMEISAFLKEQAPSANLGQGDLFGGNGSGDAPQTMPTPSAAVIFELPNMPDVSSLSDAEKSQIVMSENAGTAVVRVEGSISENIQTILVQQLGKKKEKDKLQQNIRVHNQRIEVAKAPSERGEAFGSLPQVCLHDQQEIELVEPSTFLYINNWSLLDFPAETIKL